MASDAWKNLTKTMPRDPGMLHELDHAESDRGASLLGASCAEFALFQFLKSHMVALNPSEEGTLFFSSGPLSELSSRTNIAYAFDLINTELRDDLAILREIRNAFAHSPRLIKFDHDGINARCGRFNSIKVFWTKPTTARLQFMCAVKAIFIGLMFASRGETPPPPFGLSGYPGCAIAKKRSLPAP